MKEFISKKLPQRYILCIMGSLGILNAYTMRISLAMAITEMVIFDNTTSISNKTNDEGSCKADKYEESLNAVTDPDILYDWSDTTQGMILGSFFIGYVITHIPGSLLAERYGAKHVIGFGNLVTAIATLLIPSVMHATDGSAAALIVIRSIAGLGQGPIYPAMTTILSQWIPSSERTTIGSIVYSGSQIGTIVANLGSGALIQCSKDWQWVFYLFGGFGVLWFALWLVLCYSYPDTHPFISEAEKKYLHDALSEEIAKDERKKRRKTPFKAIFTSAPLWALVAVQTSHDWGANTLMSDLPKYMKEVLKFNVMDNGIWTSIPYLMWFLVSLIAGAICDWTIRNQKLSSTATRKVFATICCLGPTSFMLAASFAGCNKKLVVAMFVTSMSFYGAFYCVKVNAMDLAPNYSGTLMALANGVGSISGIFAPYVVGSITSDHTIQQWRIIFSIATGVSGTAFICFMIFGRGEKQAWNDADDREKVEKK